MKRKLVIILMLLVLVSSVAGQADARLFKKKSERRHKHKHKNDNTAAQDSVQQAAPQPLSKKQIRKQEKKLKKEKKKQDKLDRKKQKHDRKVAKKNKSKVQTESGRVPVTSTVSADGYPLTKMKDRYRVDILATLYLDDLVKGESVTYGNKIPDKAEQGLAFYEGILIAADTLKKSGFNIDIYVHDIASAKDAPGMLVAKGDLDSSDLVIGAVPQKELPMLAAYAKNKQINFVSAITYGDAYVSNNAYFTMMQPSLKSHCEWISGNVSVKYEGMDVTVFYRSNVQDEAYAYKYLSNSNNFKAHYHDWLSNTMPTKERMEDLFDTSKPNVVIIPILDVAYADSLLSMMSRWFPRTHFEVYGMPTWASMPDLHREGAFPNLSINITRPFYVDPSAPAARYVSRIYRRDYGNKVPEMVYRGYETMFWYANLLKKYGTIFNVKYEDNTTAPFTGFEIKPQLDRSGRIIFYENKHVFVSKYEGGINKTE